MSQRDYNIILLRQRWVPTLRELKMNDYHSYTAISRAELGGREVLDPSELVSDLYNAGRLPDPGFGDEAVIKKMLQDRSRSIYYVQPPMIPQTVVNVFQSAPPAPSSAPASAPDSSPQAATMREMPSVAMAKGAKLPQPQDQSLLFLCHSSDACEKLISDLIQQRRMNQPDLISIGTKGYVAFRSFLPLKDKSKAMVTICDHSKTEIKSDLINDIRPRFIFFTLPLTVQKGSSLGDVMVASSLQPQYFALGAMRPLVMDMKKDVDWLQVDERPQFTQQFLAEFIMVNMFNEETSTSKPRTPADLLKACLALARSDKYNLSLREDEMKKILRELNPKLLTSGQIKSDGKFLSLSESTVEKIKDCLGNFGDYPAKMATESVMKVKTWPSEPDAMSEFDIEPHQKTRDLKLAVETYISKTRKDKSKLPEPKVFLIGAVTDFLHDKQDDKPFEEYGSKVTASWVSHFVNKNIDHLLAAPPQEDDD